MLTIFTTPKPFRGHIGVIQRNAIRSWTLLHPDIEIILFGDEEGTGEVCAKHSLCYEPYVERRTPTSPPYLNYLFTRAQKLARHDALCYVNCDIVLMSDFRKAVERVSRGRKRFLMAGQRWKIDVTEPLDFDRPGWQEELRHAVRERGAQSSVGEIDYFVFSKGLFREIPPLVIGRACWDQWLMWKARREGACIIDSTSAVLAVHQNHDYSLHPDGMEGVFGGEEAKRNLELAGGGRHRRMLVDSTHRLTSEGSLRRTPMRGQIYRHWPKIKCALWELFIFRTFSLRQKLGLRKEPWRKLLKKA